MKNVNIRFSEDEQTDIEMDQEVAQRLFVEGGTIVLKDVPVGTEFGIDMNSWTTGPKFMGVKMIPPGIHFIYFRAANVKDGMVSPRTGLFHNFSRGELLVRRWDIDVEKIVDDVLVKDQENMKQDLRNLDKNLGVFPYQSWKKWVPLTNRIDRDIIERLMPESGEICSVSNMVPEEPTRKGLETGVHSEELNLEPQPQSQIQYTRISRFKHPPDSSPMEISKHNLDSSYQLQLYMGQIKRPGDILGEMQFSFVCFLVGQDYSSFSHWKCLVALLCGCDHALLTHPQLFLHFIGDLHFQLREVPDDFFVDIVSKDNFLVKCLTDLFMNIRENSGAILSLKSKSRQLEEHLSERFNLDFSLENEEDSPVVVEL